MCQGCDDGHYPRSKLLAEDSASHARALEFRERVKSPDLNPELRNMCLDAYAFSGLPFEEVIRCDWEDCTHQRTYSTWCFCHVRADYQRKLASLQAEIDALPVDCPAVPGPVIKERDYLIR